MPGSAPTTHRSPHVVWAFLIVGIGVLLRLVVSLRGHNWDVDSYLIVCDIMNRGGNVYNETVRYNYGPIWFYILHALDGISSFLPGDRVAVLAALLTLLLTAADVGIFLILRRCYGLFGASLFFLNPISIFISGYHRQFENLAILLAMAAVLLWGADFQGRLTRRKIAGLGLLGLSLMLKHIFFLFPLWLAVNRRGLKPKAAILLIPSAVFLAGFVPYWASAHEAILNNVFFYRSLNYQCFYDLFIPPLLQQFYTPFAVWIFLLVFFAFLFRAKPPMESLLAYTAIFTAAAPSTANQYLAIPIVFLSLHPNVFSLFYTALGTWHLLGDRDGLHVAAVKLMCSCARGDVYRIMIVLLAFAILWAIGKARILSLARQIVQELRDQFARP